MEAPNPNEVIFLKKLKIQNVRCFDAFEFEFEPPEFDAGQWTILLGDNGVGKSTILRSIALATSDERVAWTLLDNLGGNWIRQGVDAVANVHLHTNLDDWHQHYQRGSRKGETMVEGVSGATPMVLAYGTGRGTALGGPDRAVRLEAQTEGRQTLFYQGNLVHAETWLKNMAFAATESEYNKDYFAAVTKTLVGLLPGIDQLSVNSEGVWARGPNVGKVPLSALSDGFLTTLGWTLDMIARWAYLAQQNDTPLDGEFCHQMTGLVLIDELDLHLHPRWQSEIVSRLRQTFPRLSFVATTHNPLTLRGARKGEIQVLERIDGQTSVRQIDIRPGLRADELLTGSWFGLSHTLDNDTVEMIEQYQKLVMEAPDQPHAKAMEDELRNRLGTFADTKEERLALKMVAEATKSGSLEKAEQEQLKQRMNKLLNEGSQSSEGA